MANFKDSSHFKVHDDYYTRACTLDMIIPYIPKDKVIWEPFLLNSNEQSKKYLQSKGFEVVGDNTIDFFEHNLGEVLIGNPPFETHLKKRILKRLVQIDKPFILIMNSLNLFTKYFHEIFGDNQKDVHLIIPRKKIHYDKFVEGEKVDCGNKTSYYSVFVTYKLLKHNIFL